MLRTLLINCSLSGKLSPSLLEAVSKFSEPKVVYFSDITCDSEISKEIDAVVISGSAARIVNTEDKEKFRGVLNLIRTCDVPIFSICFGHQLLCNAFGAKASTLIQPMFDCFEQIRVLKPDDIFVGLPRNLPLSENHNDYVLKDSLASAGFVLLADSASCEVEAVKHGSKPFWGVQFHPERITLKGENHPEGHQVIENFFKEAVKR